MQYFPPEVITLLDAGQTIVRGLIRFYLGGGTYGFIRARSKFTWDGTEFLPGGVLKVSDIAGGTGFAARQFTIELAASPDDELTPEVLRTIEDEDYRDRPVRIYDAHFHPDTNAFLFVKTMARGYIDTIDQDEGEEGFKLIAACETRAMDYTRTNGRLRTPDDQRRRNPNDGFYDNASKRGREELDWGQEKKS